MIITMQKSVFYILGTGLSRIAHARSRVVWFSAITLTKEKNIFNFFLYPIVLHNAHGASTFRRETVGQTYPRQSFDVVHCILGFESSFPSVESYKATACELKKKKSQMIIQGDPKIMEIFLPLFKITVFKMSKLLPAYFSS